MSAHQKVQYQAFNRPSFKHWNYYTQNGVPVFRSNMEKVKILSKSVWKSNVFETPCTSADITLKDKNF